MNPRARFAVVVVAGALALVSGCGRRTHVEYPHGDSLAGARADSATIAVREAQQAWDAPGGAEAAARLSARALTLVLAAEPVEEWANRAQAFLDSLGVGGELAGADGALAVNFFSRADPSAGSWPYLFWSGAAGPESQPIEGRSMRLLRLASRGLTAPPARRDPVPPAVAMLFDRRAALGTEPFLMVWARRGASWTITQTLGPDSLGGAGTGEFESHADSVLLVTRTYRASRGFEECPSCPHVFRVRRFVWGRDGFGRLEDSESPSPYSSFVHFVHALVADDRDGAQELVTDDALVEAARRAGFGEVKGLWRLAPATDETATHMVFLRGAAEAYDVEFSLRDGVWRIAGIQTAEQHVE